MKLLRCVILILWHGLKVYLFSSTPFDKLVLQNNSLTQLFQVTSTFSLCYDSVTSLPEIEKEKKKKNSIGFLTLILVEF